MEIKDKVQEEILVNSFARSGVIGIQFSESLEENLIAEGLFTGKIVRSVGAIGGIVGGSVAAAKVSSVILGTILASLGAVAPFAIPAVGVAAILTVGTTGLLGAIGGAKVGIAGAGALYADSMTFEEMIPALRLAIRSRDSILAGVNGMDKDQAAAYLNQQQSKIDSLTKEQMRIGKALRKRLNTKEPIQNLSEPEYKSLRKMADIAIEGKFSYLAKK